MRRHLTLAFVAMTLFLTLVPISTQQGIKDYDPWADLNDDGKIDIWDVAFVASKFGTYGTPINKTGLLLDLLEKIEILNSTVVELQSTVTYLNETVVYLNGTGLGAPDYDSGWQPLSYPGELYLTHNLNTTDLLVYFMGRYYSGEVPVTHQYSFGSQYDPIDGYLGAWWATTNTTIILYRAPGDSASLFQPWNEARVLIWKIP